MIAGEFYHIFNRGNNREIIFKEPRNYAFFLQKFKHYLGDKVEVHAYCLMPNHFHFLSKAKPITDKLKSKIEQGGTKRGLAFLSGDVPASTFYESQFASLFKSYTNAINKQEENRFGGLFKAKFRRTLVKDKKDFLHFLCYVHHN
ncbi:MAG: transposase, partial [Chitinophagales bacterium]